MLKSISEFIEKGQKDYLSFNNSKPGVAILVSFGCVLCEQLPLCLNKHKASLKNPQ